MEDAALAGGSQEPPDIRAFARHKSHRTKHSKHSSTTTAQHNNGLVGALVVVFCIALCLPVASAQTTSPNDVYTSYNVPTKHTPILDGLAWVFGHVVSAASHVTNTDLATVLDGHSHFLKRKLSDVEIAEACMIPVLVALSGIFAGLTLGYFSVDQTQLQVLSISGTAKQQEHARKIIPVRKDSHLLLTTLILGNMIVNEALPVVSDNVLGGGIQAVVVSTALVVIFAEIIPQSVCSRYGLLIGAKMAFPVRCLMYLAFPIAWPIAKLLEYILGAHHGIIYRRSELRELIKMHAAGAEGGGDLDLDTVTMAQGALDLAGKKVREAMTPIDKVFMLPIEAKLDYETLGHVVRSGHSRVPVYQTVEVPNLSLTTPPPVGSKGTKTVKKVIGSLLVKSCVLLDPEDATPLATIPINAIPSVPCDEPLTNMLNVFQEGRSHMAIVSRRPRRIDPELEDVESVMTAAAGGLRQRFMRKVAGITHGDKSSSSGSDTSGDENEAERGESKTRKRKQSKAKSVSQTETSESSATVDNEKTVQVTSAKPQTQAQKLKQETEAAESKKRSLALTQLEQTVPADAQMPPAMMEKFFDGLEGAPLGIITLEDVLEELIGEEIYDEYDEHGGPRNAASAFIPREAALAARKAVLDRENALAQNTPLPVSNDAELEQPTTGQPRRIPKINMPKFSLGRRPASQPGRARTLGMEVQNDKSVVPTPQPQPAAVGATPILEQSANVRSASPTGLADDDEIPVRSASEQGLSGRRQSEGSPTVLDPASAVPVRLLPTGTATQPVGPNMLSGAILVERRRRLAGQTGSVPAPRAVSAGVSRNPTPPDATVFPAAGQVVASPAAIPDPLSGILSPTPVAAKPRGKFKSVPTPIATPKPTSSSLPQE